jgi:hypothetical protein
MTTAALTAPEGHVDRIRALVDRKIVIRPLKNPVGIGYPPAI